MAGRVHLACDGDSAVLAIDNPPVNAGAHDIRKRLLAAIGEVEAGLRLKGAVPIGAGRRFIAEAAGPGRGTGDPRAPGADIAKGGISVASQSGGIMGALLSRGAARGTGFCKLASTGNEADIDIADLIEA